MAAVRTNGKEDCRFDTELVAVTLTIISLVAFSERAGFKVRCRQFGW